MTPSSSVAAHGRSIASAYRRTARVQVPRRIASEEAGNYGRAGAGAGAVARARAGAARLAHTRAGGRARVAGKSGDCDSDVVRQHHVIGATPRLGRIPAVALA